MVCPRFSLTSELPNHPDDEGQNRTLPGAGATVFVDALRVVRGFALRRFLSGVKQIRALDAYRRVADVEMSVLPAKKALPHGLEGNTIHSNREPESSTAIADLSVTNIVAIGP
jgi:hypothetical protein